MDRSADSIGSCSLDVDVDSSDISDTSGSLNFPTPISVKDVTKEFTSNLRERCSIHTLQNPTPTETEREENRLVMKQPSSGVTESSAFLTNTATTYMSSEKKPSYLNLACCVSGYSNLTTYDSKVRQDINKSREVSPIRPSSSGIQHCRNNNSLVPPVLLPMHINTPKFASAVKSSSGNTHDINNKNLEKFRNFTSCGENSRDESRATSFIQERVERLYGPGALAQGFYSPKKAVGDPLGHLKNKTQENDKRQGIFETSDERVDVDLPVLRHLSQEFRAQLPIVSPKRNPSRLTTMNTNSKTNQTNSVEISRETCADVIDFKTTKTICTPCVNEEVFLRESDSITKGKEAGDIELNNIHFSNNNINITKKDGHHFLKLLASEQKRLLELAMVAETYIDELSDKTDITEDIFGLLRSASGKARLLVSQKMKQFEGLCHNNLNASPNDQFPTTDDDLQGFWDMVYLQVDHIDSIFHDIEVLKSNNWKNSAKAVKFETPIKQNSNQKIAKKKTNPPNGNCSKAPSVASSVSSQKRESQRKQLLEMKRKNKLAMTAKTTSSQLADLQTNSIEIFISDNSSPKPI